MSLGLHAKKKNKQTKKNPASWYLSFLLFFSIQRAYSTQKQNLVKFKYTQVIN